MSFAVTPRSAALPGNSRAIFSQAVSLITNRPLSTKPFAPPQRSLNHGSGPRGTHLLSTGPRSQRGIFLRLEAQVEAAIASTDRRLAAATAEVNETNSRLRAAHRGTGRARAGGALRRPPAAVSPGADHGPARGRAGALYARVLGGLRRRRDRARGQPAARDRARRGAGVRRRDHAAGARPGRSRTKTGSCGRWHGDDRPWGGTDPPAVVYRYAPGRGQQHTARCWAATAASCNATATPLTRSWLSPRGMGRRRP